MKLYKNILITFLTAIIAIAVLYGGYTIYAEDGYTFKIQGLSFREVFDAYHGGMNDYFNGKISKLNTLLDKPEFYLEDDFIVPDIDPVNDDFAAISEKCKENVSTYCVAIGALDRYIEYVKVLNNLLGTLANEESEDSAFMSGVKNIGALLETTEERNKKINAEFSEAKEVLEAAIAAYNEYRLAYPLHKRYEQIIKDLIKYKLALKAIRREATFFPIKFIDATSSQCE